MRKYFLDNIRWICVLLLFPIHTCMIYNNFGENFFVRGDSIPFLSMIIESFSPWYMRLLFAIAGISTFYALKKRTAKKYFMERVYKLLIPMIAGIVLIVPIQTFYGEKFHNGYTGGFFNQYILFFTKVTDLSGYTGGFTPSQLWFMLYLFIISILALPVAIKYNKKFNNLAVHKLSVLQIIPLYLISIILLPVLRIGGKSLGEYFIIFMLGYIVLSNDIVHEKLDKNRWYLLISLIILTALNLLSRNLWNWSSGLLYDVFTRFISWVGILAMLGLGKHYLNFRNSFTEYFSKASFPIYIFHQSWLVLVAYYMFQFTSNVAVQVVSIIIGSFIITMLSYEIFKRIPFVRFLFGIRK